MNGKELVEALVYWAIKRGMHPDDFADLFVHELLELLEEDAE